MSAPELRMPRGRRGTAGTLTALLLTVVTAAVGYLGVMKALQRPVTWVDLPAAVRWLQQTTWGSPVVLVAGIVLAAIGVVLLLAALLPPSRHVVELVSPRAGVATAITPGGLRRTLAAAAVGVDGVTEAGTRLGRRRIRVDATTRLRRTDGLSDATTAAVQRRLQVLDLRRAKVPAIRLHRKES